MKYRYERFGGIISVEDPPMLAIVDREFMRGLGIKESGLWRDKVAENHYLCAPIEVHFALTNACPLGCEHCYKSSGRAEDHSMDTAEIKKILDVLSRMGVFNVAFGGGDPVLREDLFEIGEYTASLGMVPTLTISGAFLSADMARRLRVFERVNVSVDGIDDLYGVMRGNNYFKEADNAIGLLIKNHINTGMNTIIGRDNFDHLPEIFRYAKKKGIDEINILRLKPSGRAIEIYEKKKATNDQNKRLMPLLASLSDRYEIPSRIDCSLLPMFCYHNPDIDLIRKLSIFGCEPANVTLGITSNGYVNGCSFMSEDSVPAIDLEDFWDSHEGFSRLRTWTDNAPEPCRSCRYLDICRGGCKVVSMEQKGSMANPDPDCPVVVEYRDRCNKKGRAI